MSAYADDNISWADDYGLPGYEPWEPYELDDDGCPAGGCAYCEATEVRENPEPFGGQPCCEACFNILIGGSPDDPPWRCGTDTTADATPQHGNAASVRETGPGEAVASSSVTPGPVLFSRGGR